MSWLSKDLIVESLEELSDRELQLKLWLSDGSTDVSSFDEAVEQLFTDSGLVGALEKGRTGYSIEVEDDFRRLNEQLKRIDRNRDLAEIISSSDMELVRKSAAEILERINS